MKITKWALSAAIAATCLGGSVFAQTPAGPSSNDYGYYSSEAVPAASASIGDDNPVVPASSSEYSSIVPAAYGCSDSPISGCCDTGGCCDGGCDGGCDSACGGGCGCGGGLLGLGLFGACGEDANNLLSPILGTQIGGWAQMGYHTYDNSLFNAHSDQVRLHQAWLYAEKVADGSNGIGFGGRMDYVYGVDAQDTQAFGIENNHWDNSWDNGIYGHAIPQLYGEVAVGDLSVIAGHFFTLIGYEVVGAPGNFFYSHSYTMFNSEPFTHTGVLGTYGLSDAITVYGGWVMGWDSGFEDNGDAFLGGYAVDVSDNLNVVSQYIVGRFGEGANPIPNARAGGEVGWMTSTVATAKLTDAITYVLWFDLLDTDRGQGRTNERETFDWNNYLLVSLSDCVTWGTRFEYYNIDRGVYNDPNTNAPIQAGRSDIYQLTTGFNLAAGSNVLFRPELRWDWNKDRVLTSDNTPILELGGNATQTTFGMDAIMQF